MMIIGLLHDVCQTAAYYRQPVCSHQKKGFRGQRRRSVGRARGVVKLLRPVCLAVPVSSRSIGWLVLHQVRFAAVNQRAVEMQGRRLLVAGAGRGQGLRRRSVGIRYIVK